MEDLAHLDDASVKGATEAILLVSSDPLSAVDLAKILGIQPGEAAGVLA